VNGLGSVLAVVGVALVGVAVVLVVTALALAGFSWLCQSIAEYEARTRWQAPPDRMQRDSNGCTGRGCDLGSGSSMSRRFRGWPRSVGRALGLL
jgi:hypothetical protein